jgi:hypothetical protein
MGSDPRGFGMINPHVPVALILLTYVAILAIVFYAFK